MRVEQTTHAASGCKDYIHYQSSLLGRRVAHGFGKNSPLNGPPQTPESAYLFPWSALANQRTRTPPGRGIRTLCVKMNIVKSRAKGGRKFFFRHLRAMVPISRAQTVG